MLGTGWRSKATTQTSANLRAEFAAAFAAGFAMVCVSFAHAQIPCRYELVATIQGPNCQWTGPVGLTPTAISPNGMYVTGWYGQCDVGDEAFLWIGPPPGTLFRIPRPTGAVSARGADVNDSGMVCGSYEQTIGQATKWRGFVYKYATNQWISLSPENPNGWSDACALNNAATVVGWRGIGTTQFPSDYPREAFIWTEGTGFRVLGVMNGPSSAATDISENGIVVGWTGTDGTLGNNNTRAFFYQNGTTTILRRVPGGFSSLAKGVNSNAQIVISGKIQSIPTPSYQTFLYHAGIWTALPAPNGFDSAGGFRIADNGTIPGSCGHAGSNVYQACLWNGTSSFVFQDRVSPPVIDFSHGNYAISASETGPVLLYAHTFQGLEVAFIVGPAPRMLGDTNCDEHVNIDDLFNVVLSWGPCQGCSADFDRNGVVNIDDLFAVINNWSP